MSQPSTNKIVPGIMAFLPIALMVLWFVAWFLMLIPLMADEDRVRQGLQEDDLPNGFIPMLIALGIVLLFNVGAFIYFVVHVVKNPRIQGDNRTVWILLMIFGGSIAHIVYFFMFVVADPRPNEGAPFNSLQ